MLPKYFYFYFNYFLNYTVAPPYPQVLHLKIQSNAGKKNPHTHHPPKKEEEIPESSKKQNEFAAALATIYTVFTLYLKLFT